MMVDSVVLVVVSDMGITTMYSYNSSSYDEQKFETVVRVRCTMCCPSGIKLGAALS